MKTKQSCYLDANFLIAFFLPNHEDEKTSRKKMFDLFAQHENLLVSCLALDETMHKICTVSNNQAPKGQRKKKHRDFYPLYEGMLKYILKNPLMNLIQFENNLEQGLRNAIENIREYDLEPHDAFHYAMMQDLNVNCIVTNDKDFEEIKGIKIISF
jgi:predicted nucleic acid-binding protein